MSRIRCVWPLGRCAVSLMPFSRLTLAILSLESAAHVLHTDYVLAATSKQC